MKPLKIVSAAAFFAFSLLSPNTAISDGHHSTKTPQRQLEFQRYAPNANDGFARLARVRESYESKRNRVVEGKIVLKLKTGKHENSTSYFEILTGLKRITNIRFPFADMLSSRPDADICGLSRICEIYYSDPIHPKDLLPRLVSDAIEYAEPVLEKQFLFAPNDPLYPGQYAMKRIMAEKAWDVTYGADDLIIGVVDSETDWEHEDLKYTIYNNPGEMGTDDQGIDKRFNGIDDDGNGKIDDWHGWDFAGNTTPEEAQQGIVHEDNDTKIRDENSKFNHGTFVTSCVTAITNNGMGMAGTCPRCQILPVKIRSDYGALFRGHEGILYAALMGAKFINCSWTWIGETESEREVVRTASALGALIVGGAGNSNDLNDDYSIVYDNFQEVLFAGSTDEADTVSSFSSYGTTVGVFAPGRAITCAVPYDKYAPMTGTSMSSPITAGIAGLVYSVHRDWLPKQYMHQLRSTSDRFTAGNGSDGRQKYYGRANALSAVTINSADQASVPGCRFDSASINSSTGTVNTYSPLKLRLFLTNYLATAKGLVVSIAADSPLVNIDNAVRFDSLGAMESNIAEFSISASASAYWYHKMVKATVKFSDENGYEDYQILYIPLELPATGSATYFPKEVGNISETFARADSVKIISASSPSMHDLWICGFNESNSTVVWAHYSDTKLVNSGTLPDSINKDPTKIYALSETTAFMIVPYREYFYALLRTTDGGTTWQEMPRDANFWSITEIRFFDRNTGLLLGADMINPRKHLLRTTDGGSTWRPAIDFPFTDEGEYLLEDKLCGFSGCIGLVSNKSKLYITEDKAENWKVLKFPRESYITDFSPTSARKVPLVYMALDEKALTDVDYRWSYFDSHENSFKENSHNLWNMIASPLAMCTSLMDEKSIVIDEQGKAIATLDSGANWIPVSFANKFTFSGLQKKLLAATVHDGLKTRIWLVSDRVEFFDADSEFSPDNGWRRNGIISACLIYPNPTAATAKLQFYLEKDSDTEIEVYNTIGSRVLELFSGRVAASEFRTIDLDLSWLAQGEYIVRIRTGNDTFDSVLQVSR